MQIVLSEYCLEAIAQKYAWPLCNFIVANKDRLKHYFPKKVQENLNRTLSQLFTTKKERVFLKGEEYLFTVNPKLKRKIIGLIYDKILHKNPIEGKLAYWVGYPYQGKGLTSLFVSHILKWAYSKLGLECVKSIVHKSNSASIRIAEKHGFEWQRTLAKEHRTANGAVLDMECLTHYAYYQSKSI